MEAACSELVDHPYPRQRRERRDCTRHLLNRFAESKPPSMYTQGRRRAAPSVIIVSLIDVLLVNLFFDGITTLRQTPAVKLALPEARQSEKSGASPNQLVVTIAKTEPHLYLAKRPVTFEKLQEELLAMVTTRTNLMLLIQADEGAPWGQVVKVMDAAKAAKFRSVDAITRSPGG